MDLKEVLYSFEHKLLPEWFYGNPKEFAGVLATQPGALYSIIAEICSRAGVENTFVPREFSVEPDQISSDVAAIRIKFPKPPESPLCLSSVAFFDKTFEKVCYFTIEMGDETSAGFPVICSWEKNGEHINYGSESHDLDECLVKCVNQYMERFFEQKNG
ncbi:MAG: hypothetical protein IJM08_07730 [Firmicutes bacterium]|nr:hypothetical protein [Bacillota bacterium]